MSAIFVESFACESCLFISQDDLRGDQLAIGSGIMLPPFLDPLRLELARDS